MRYLILFLMFKAMILADGLWTIDEYVNLYPIQKPLMQQFENVVQNDAVALTKMNKTIKISILYPGNQLSDYWRRSQESFELRMKELNISYEINPQFSWNFF